MKYARQTRDRTPAAMTPDLDFKVTISSTSAVRHLENDMLDPIHGLQSCLGAFKTIIHQLIIIIIYF